MGGKGSSGWFASYYSFSDPTRLNENACRTNEGGIRLTQMAVRSASNCLSVLTVLSSVRNLPSLQTFQADRMV